MEEQQTSGSGNPLCEAEAQPPRDCHRMRPVDGYPGVWVCVKHDLFVRSCRKMSLKPLSAAIPI